MAQNECHCKCPSAIVGSEQRILCLPESDRGVFLAPFSWLTMITLLQTMRRWHLISRDIVTLSCRLLRSASRAVRCRKVSSSGVDSEVPGVLVTFP